MIKDYRLKFHIQPINGWLNDPNGLCQYKGVYHIFYQYTPNSADGNGNRLWAHVTTKDFIHWKRHENAIYPDTPVDRDGAYSGSALTDGKMYLFYTGNVKHKGDYDYIYNGREANTILIESEDGYNFSPKKLLMNEGCYPDDYTCHIRDPKVWKEAGKYYMVQGGRKKDDSGSILLFSSKNIYKWEFVKELTTTEKFGYMWECPDYFEVDKKHILSFSPQGVEAKTHKYQNVYQSGYTFLDKKITDNNCSLNKNLKENFCEWDRGFDFYAPQTFMDEQGRRILIGWAGIPDADYNNEPSIKAGWQHALTMPRLIEVKNDKLYTKPLPEYEKLRKDQRAIKSELECNTQTETFELEALECCQKFDFEMSDGRDSVSFLYNEGILSLQISGAAAAGRKIRTARCNSLQNVRIFADTSLLEIYVNDGELVFTTRFYFEEDERFVKVSGSKEINMWTLEGQIWE